MIMLIIITTVHGDTGIGQMSVGHFVGSSSSASINKIAVLLLIASLFNPLYLQL